MTSDPGSQNNPFASPVSAELDLTQWVPGNNAFAVEFYRRMCEPAGNLFFSPASLSIALTMLYAGACGETAREVAQTLQLGLPPNLLPPAVSGLWHTFQVGAK